MNLSRLGQECVPGGFPNNIPGTALFDPKKVVIVNNGRYVKFYVMIGTSLC